MNGIEANYYVEPADWKIDHDAIAEVRLTVFVAEQAVPEDEEFDDEDPVAQHFLAYDLAGDVLGTARLTRDGKIGRMAVVKEARGSGVGQALLRACIEAARLRGDRELTLAAQCHALDFYARLGFEAYGEVFDDVGIPHRCMRLQLAEEPMVAAPEPPRREPGDLPDAAVGDFDSKSDLAALTLALIESCGRRLDIFTRDLDPETLDRDAPVAALKSLLAFAQEPMVRIVVIDSSAAVAGAHRWVELAQTRSTAMQIRNPAPRHAREPRAFMIADRRHVIERPLASRYEGRLIKDAPRHAKRLLEFFEDAWEHATPDPEMRKLDL